MFLNRTLYAKDLSVSSEAEAYLVVLVYVLLGAIVLLLSLLSFAYIWFRDYAQETREFIRLMIQLYEDEKQRNDKS